MHLETAIHNRMYKLPWHNKAVLRRSVEAFAHHMHSNKFDKAIVRTTLKKSASNVNTPDDVINHTVEELCKVNAIHNNNKDRN